MGRSQVEGGGRGVYILFLFQAYIILPNIDPKFGNYPLKSVEWDWRGFSKESGG